MNNEPIIVFDDLEHAHQCLKEWQERLFLTNWIIQFSFSKNLVNNNGDELFGQNTLYPESNCCHIELAIYDEKDSKENITKACQELTLIHELLHCKYNFLKYKDTLEGIYFDVKEHALLDQMAKSLLMTKYGISYDWFKNF